MQESDLPSFRYQLTKFIRSRYKLGRISGNGVVVTASKILQPILIFSLDEIKESNRNLVLSVADILYQGSINAFGFNVAEIRGLESLERLVLISRGWEAIPEKPQDVRKAIG